MSSLSILQAQTIVNACLDVSVKVTSINIVEQPISYGISKPPAEYILRVIESTEESVKAPALTYSIVLDERKAVIDTYARVLQLLDKQLSSNTRPTIIKIDHAHIMIPNISYILQSYPFAPNFSETTTLASLKLDNVDTELGRNLKVAEAELRIGQTLKLINAIENEWYGGFGDENGLDMGEDEDEDGSFSMPKEACISWQECFTWMIESLLDETEIYLLEQRKINSDLEGLRKEDVLPIDLGEIRLWMSSAIGMYLFDDVEVPVLVWNPGLDWDESVILPSDSSETSMPISFIRWTRSLWGDPLLEGTFYSPTPAVLEGYGGSPIVFARQQTKRLWYTLWASLDAYLQLARSKNERLGKWDKEKLKDLLKKTVAQLRNAKYY